MVVMAVLVIFQVHLLLTLVAVEAEVKAQLAAGVGGTGGGGTWRTTKWRGC
jgi:hypothetical protein